MKPLVNSCYAPEVRYQSLKFDYPLLFLFNYNMALLGVIFRHVYLSRPGEIIIKYYKQLHVLCEIFIETTPFIKHFYSNKKENVTYVDLQWISLDYIQFLFWTIIFFYGTGVSKRVSKTSSLPW